MFYVDIKEGLLYSLSVQGKFYLPMSRDSSDYYTMATKDIIKHPTAQTSPTKNYLIPLLKCWDFNGVVSVTVIYMSVYDCAEIGHCFLLINPSKATCIIHSSASFSIWTPYQAKVPTVKEFTAEWGWQSYAEWPHKDSEINDNKWKEGDLGIGRRHTDGWDRNKVLGYILQLFFSIQGNCMN